MLVANFSSLKLFSQGSDLADSTMTALITSLTKLSVMGNVSCLSICPAAAFKYERSHDGFQTQRNKIINRVGVKVSEQFSNFVKRFVKQRIINGRHGLARYAVATNSIGVLGNFTKRLAAGGAMGIAMTVPEQPEFQF